MRVVSNRAPPFSVSRRRQELGVSRFRGFFPLTRYGLLDQAAAATLGPVKILFGWELGGGMGHLAPHRALFEALLARGHRLHLCVREPVRAERVFSDLDISIQEAPFH